MDTDGPIQRRFQDHATNSLRIFRQSWTRHVPQVDGMWQPGSMPFQARKAVLARNAIIVLELRLHGKSSPNTVRLVSFNSNDFGIPPRCYPVRTLSVFYGGIQMICSSSREAGTCTRLSHELNYADAGPRRLVPPQMHRSGHLYIINRIRTVSAHCTTVEN